ncbi:DNA polymerase III subunit alpha [Bacillus marasmi]|uniref:DNA polymerase III subunit alpha n=1 Tax=Bacillus marasmi TaxID=1926279 RepID=UPI0011C9C5C1|nr:DNA polymerase III subunit alpha [Bacillus marasmi]
MAYVHLQVYSSYSLLSSTAEIRQLVQNAKNKGYSAIALTDKNVLYATVNFYKECLKHSIKPIFGLTVDIEADDAQTPTFPLVLLAKNQTGFQNLLKISSAVQTKSKTGLPIKWLKHYADGLIAITPGVSGEIETSLLNGDIEKAYQSAERYQAMFGPENFYVSLQNHNLKAEAFVQSEIMTLGQKLNIPLVVTNAVQYLEKEDAFSHEVLLAIKNGVKLSDENRERLETSEYYLKSPAEMVELYGDYPDALENTLKIAANCQVQLNLNEQRLPKYPVANGMNAETLLEQICLAGFQKRYQNPTTLHKKRLQYELSIINKMKFSDYFLIVWDFMKYAREQGILTGPGRGSAAGSMVAYVLQITDIDPIEHGLLFERFLNPERITMPDIDIDFPDTRREEVIQYVMQKYGQLHVAQIITFGTLAARAALKDVGRVFGLNPKELDQLTSLVPAKLGITLKDAYQESERLRIFITEADLLQRLFETATKLEGLPRHTSTHAAGVVISELPLVETVPIQAGHNEVYLTQYAMESLQEVGLLKMDFLGLRNLSFIESILETIYRYTRTRIDIRNIPINDEKTYALLAAGNTTGVFQLESDGMRKVLKQLVPSAFEDIVAVNALYRPGPMENIPLFINRKHGREQIAYPHRDLEPILNKTYGVIIYQEQIMQIASSMAGFSLGEADLLRRAVSKKQKQTLDRERQHFVTGALKNQYSETTANEIYDLIVRFANYGFNRSHAVAYSFIAYQLAYLKAHYPVYFMANLLTSAVGNETKLMGYLHELSQMEIKLLPPSVNDSDTTFKIEGDSIRYSLLAIKGVGGNALKAIMAARRRKRFQDLFDFCLRVSPKLVNRKTLEALVLSGSFDEFGEDRAVLLASLDVAIEHAQLFMPEEGAQIDFFEADELMPKPKYVEVDPLTIEAKLAYEKEILGFFLSDHPLAAYQQELRAEGLTPLSDLQPGNRHAVKAVYVSNIKKIRTKKGEPMAFLVVSDQSAECEAVIFPQAFKKMGHLLQQGTMWVLDGGVEERDGKLQFIIKDGKGISGYLSKKNKTRLFLKVVAEKQTQELLNKLHTILHQYPGEIEVVLYYEGLEKTVRLAKSEQVDGTDSCIKELQGLLGFDNVILK